MAELDEAIAKRSMPYSLEAEQTVIASMVMDAEAINVVSEMLCGDDFYTKQYGITCQWKSSGYCYIAK